MTKQSSVIVYIASSLDGFIAGADNDLSWLPQDMPESSEGIDFKTFFEGVGVLLMGRRTFNVVESFDCPWPYGDTPVLVATRSELSAVQPSVQTIEGDIQEIVAKAKELATGKNVYLDGGNLIRQALDANLIDEVILTVIPTVLGEGLPLFAGARKRHALNLLDCTDFGAGMVQLRYSIRSTTE